MGRWSNLNIIRDIQGEYWDIDHFLSIRLEKSLKSLTLPSLDENVKKQKQYMAETRGFGYSHTGSRCDKILNQWNSLLLWNRRLYSRYSYADRAILPSVHKETRGSWSFQHCFLKRTLKTIGMFTREGVDKSGVAQNCNGILSIC